MFQKPDLKLEKQLWRAGYENVVGLDEAGKGAWAGPIVAAAVCLPVGMNIKNIGLNDSKKLTPAQREKVFVRLMKIIPSWSVGVVDAEYIDREGILPANRHAMYKALSKIRLSPDYLLVDGVKFFDHHLPHEFIIKGDGKIASIAAASIIAKVVRDYIMQSLHQKYSVYDFSKHKGYGTRFHEGILNIHGLSEIHRRSFQPMINL